MEVRTKLQVLLVLGCKEINWKFYIKVTKSNRGWVKKYKFMILGVKLLQEWVVWQMWLKLARNYNM
jgi:ribosomal protein L30/L7E